MFLSATLLDPTIEIRSFPENDFTIPPRCSEQKSVIHCICRTFNKLSKKAARVLTPDLPDC